MIRLLAVLAAFTLSPTAIFAADFAITGGKVVTNQNGQIIENGTVVIKGNRIVEVGPSSSVTIPAGFETIDAKGKWVTPGLFVPFSRVGMVEIALEKTTNDTRAKESPFSVALQAIDSFNPKSENVAITRLEGVTRMAILPDASHTIFGGRGALVDTSGDFMVERAAPAFVFIQMGEYGASIAGGSRSASWTWLRQAVAEARAWRRGREPAEPLMLTADALALQQALRDDLPFLVHVERASDLMNLIHFKQEMDGIDIIAVGATEGWMVAEQLKEAEISVILDPHDNLPQGFENLGATMYNAKRLHDAGVTIAIADLHDEAFNARLAPQHAGNTLATGLDWNTAFAAISSVPAQMFGVDDQYGQLAAGMEADLVIWDGDPLELMSAPDMVYISGEKQQMQSRQTLLRDRYMDKGADQTLPYAYR
ncbi:MAG: amidohydrolase [Robiginitomaculum sp.]|nr:MAG: amidohydrolase [Robiginitomaculum sp.]